MSIFHSTTRLIGEARLLAFAFMNSAEELNKKMSVPDELKEPDHKDDKERTKTADKNKEEKENDPEVAVKRTKLLEEQAADILAALQHKKEETDARNRAIEFSINAAKDLSGIGMYAPDGSPIETPIPESQVATLQQPEKADTRAQVNAVESRQEEQIIQPESRQEGRQKVS